MLSLSLDAPHATGGGRPRGAGAVLLMIMLLAGAATGRAQTTRPALDADDPSPKYAHDEGNSCCSPYHGPHAEPELRWWAELGVNNDDDPDGRDHHFGPAIAKIDGVRYVFVGTREGPGAPDLTGRLLIFRFHPADPNYNPFGTQGDPVPVEPVCSVDLGSPVNSTPLVLPAHDICPRTVVVQTQTNVQCWNLMGLTADPPQMTRVWQFPNNGDDLLKTGSSSPTYARLRYDVDEACVFARGQYCEYPDNYCYGAEDGLYRINATSGQAE